MNMIAKSKIYKLNLGLKCQNKIQSLGTEVSFTMSSRQYRTLKEAPSFA
jgi:hypothetical protein